MAEDLDKMIHPACPACRAPFPMCAHDDRPALILHYRHDRGSQECCEGSYAPVTLSMRRVAMETLRVTYAKWRDDCIAKAVDAENSIKWNRSNASRYEVTIVAIDDAIAALAAPVSTDDKRAAEVSP